MRHPGDRVRLTLFRRNRLMELEVTLAESPPTKWEIAGVADASAEAAARYRAWLGEPHPGAAVLAQVACGNRWV